MNSIVFLSLIILSQFNLYSETWGLSSKGTLFKMMANQVVFEWELPKQIKHSIQVDYPKTKLTRDQNHFKLCTSLGKEFVLREINFKLIVISEGQCNWKP